MKKRLKIAYILLKFTVYSDFFHALYTAPYELQAHINKRKYVFTNTRFIYAMLLNL
jgi:hypothetical protein